MPAFRFAVSTIDSRREGVIETASFGSAMQAIGQQVVLHPGDRIEIGVRGFPPACYDCVGASAGGVPFWMPSDRLAA